VRAHRCHQAKVYSATWPKTPCGKGFAFSDGSDVTTTLLGSRLTLPRPRAFYTRAVQRRGLQTILILALALLPALAALHSRSFFSPDETSYAQVAREMLESRHFVVPTIDGTPWLEKPPLVYWLLAGAFAIFGWGFPAAVLLNALLTAATALVIAAYVRRLSTPRAALISAVAYLTMFLPLAAARSALTDPALTLCTTAAIVLFLVERWPAALGAGALLGMGVLAKGPVAPLVVLPAMVAVALVRRSAASWARLGAAVVAASAVALPWHLALASHGLWPEFSAVFLRHQVLSRAAEVWGGRLPWWIYLPALWLAAFPWGTHLAHSLRNEWKRLAVSRFRDAAPVAEGVALIVPLIAFSLSVNKLPHYLLPLMPWLAVWLGRAGDDLLAHPGQARFARVTAWAGALVGAGALAALAWKLPQWQGARFVPAVAPLVLLCAALAFGAIGLAEARGTPRVAWLGFAALALALQAFLDLSLLPSLDRATVERPLAAAVRENLPPGGVAIAHRWWRASFVAYGVRGWTRTEGPDRLAAALVAAESERRPALVLVRADSEGEVRAVAWSVGRTAREVARISGLGEIDGKVLEGIVFLVTPQERDGTRVFYDADHALRGEEGLSGVEGNPWTPTFRWSVAPVSHLPLAARPPGDAVLRLRGWGRAHEGRPQRLALSLNGCPLGQLTLGGFPEVFAVRVPARCLHEPPQNLVMTTSHLDVPDETDTASRDARTLGFALDWLALDPAPDVPQGSHSVTRR
jgi:4-amino-4-deoxy-L-arabinose transferase-like glycosyltransferase